MRTYEEYEEILRLWGEGETKKGIARITGIPRGTVMDCIRRYGSLKELEEQRDQADQSFLLTTLKTPFSQESPAHRAYAYVLGLYLGDGSISKVRNVYRLRIFQDEDYVNLIRICAESMQILLPDNLVGFVQCAGCIEIGCYYKHWPSVFPQHGEGMKHKRHIILEDWQQRIVDAFPLEFFKGLYHSDGSRSQNIVKGKNYPRYLFTNESDEIRAMFCAACDRLGLRWTVANRRNICISRRDDVEYLDRVVGPKS